MYLVTKGKIPESKYLTVAELRNSEAILLKRMQRYEFNKGFLVLESGNEMNQGSRLRSLNPFLHDRRIRVGGRLKGANISEQQKHPIVLSSKYRVMRLIFENYHRNLLHCGPQLLMNDIREKYWPLSG